MSCGGRSTVILAAPFREGGGASYDDDIQLRLYSTMHAVVVDTGRADPTPTWQTYPTGPTRCE
jgi:hypothetical protein